MWVSLVDPFSNGEKYSFNTEEKRWEGPNNQTVSGPRQGPQRRAQSAGSQVNHVAIPVVPETPSSTCTHRVSGSLELGHPRRRASAMMIG